MGTEIYSVAEWKRPEKSDLWGRVVWWFERKWVAILQMAFLGLVALLAVSFAALSPIDWPASLRQSVVSLVCMLLVIGYLGLAVYVWPGIRHRLPALSGVIRRLRGIVPPEAAYVSLEIEQKKVTTGRDTGFVWHENGVLRFEGLRSSFRVLRSAVYAYPGGLSPRPRHTRANSWIVLEWQGGFVHLYFTGVGWDASSSRRRLKEQLGSWLETRSVETSGILPPLRPGLGFGSTSTLSGLAVLICWLLAIAFIFESFVRGPTRSVAEMSEPERWFNYTFAILMLGVTTIWWFPMWFRDYFRRRMFLQDYEEQV